MEKTTNLESDPFGSKTVVQTPDGTINYDPEELNRIVGGETLSYEEYIDIQKRTGKNVRQAFERLHYSVPLSFKGQVERRTKDKICFKRIFIEGMYYDGLCFDDKEDHVWMDLKGFESLKKDDSVSFFAEVYRYVKTGNGKSIDYGLRNPQGIKRIESYELPTDKELRRQEVGFLVCETCYLQEQCYGNCLLPKDVKAKKIAFLSQFIAAEEQK